MSKYSQLYEFILIFQLKSKGLFNFCFLILLSTDEVFIQKNVPVQKNGAGTYIN